MRAPAWTLRTHAFTMRSSSRRPIYPLLASTAVAGAGATAMSLDQAAPRRTWAVGMYRNQISLLSKILAPSRRSRFVLDLSGVSLLSDRTARRFRPKSNKDRIGRSWCLAPGACRVSGALARVASDRASADSRLGIPVFDAQRSDVRSWPRKTGPRSPGGIARCG